MKRTRSGDSIRSRRKIYMDIDAFPSDILKLIGGLLLNDSIHYPTLKRFVSLHIYISIILNDFRCALVEEYILFFSLYIYP